MSAIEKLCADIQDATKEIEQRQADNPKLELIDVAISLWIRASVEKVRAEAAEAKVRELEAQVGAARAVMEEFVNERDSEPDMLHCEYPRESSEAKAWHEAVYEMWRVLRRLKEPALALLAEPKGAKK